MLLNGNKERLSLILSHLDLSQDLPLLKSVPIPSQKFDSLKNSVNYFLYANLINFFPGQRFEISNNVLEQYPDQIQTLPCITGNGTVLAKTETILEYNIVHACVSRVFAELGIDEFVDQFYKIIHMRLVNGTPSPKTAKRPFATTKIHSDIWTGEPVDMIQLFFPLLGDTENTGVRFFEPKEFPENLVRTLNNYDEGANIALNSTEYTCAQFKKGEILLMDPFLLHKTVKERGGLRLSIDARFISKKKLPIKRIGPEGHLTKNYISLEKWYDIGHGHLIDTAAPLAPYSGDHSGSPTVNSEFDLVDIRKPNDLSFDINKN